ncbi:response regulator transcription factor [Novibacillus thermophilus]|uniref:DNA-binding response regulator n=1 Tax=Novibacillus thermophilus TaxID=1471761 RepID=A0A1U9K6V9_9BACL|nr:response regulator [Novibacillus thermophilus]AQS55768.1 hypothetical protein B0W44_08170 [Novibacillus thermophilus]
MNVLLVEDERTIRQGLRDLLENVIGGVSVSWEAQNGKEALQILKKEVPDLLITDVRMPEMNGLDLIAQAKYLHSFLSVVVISGYDEFDYAKKAMRYGVKHYLLKPVNRSELAMVLEEIKQELFGQKESKDHLLQDEQSKMINNIKSIISDNLCEDITLEFIGRAVNLSPSYVSQLFKKETGVNFSEFVAETRINTAKKLLIETQLKVYDIARIVGYHSAKHFMTVFKRHTALTPTKYRERYTKVD